MELKSQITVFLENQPGTMAKACGLLKEREINIQAFTLMGTVDHGVLRVIVDRTDTALSAMTKGGFLAIESKVIEILTPSTRGVLHEISEILARRKINIEYGYGSTSEDSAGDRIFLQASDNEAALRILEEEFRGGSAY